jgi:hypothetical protein
MQVFGLVVSLCTEYRILKGYIAIYNIFVVTEIVVKYIWRGREGLMV